MDNGKHILKGVVHGKTIELDRAPGLPDGQPVDVTLLPTATSEDGLRRAFGAWREDGGDLDAFLEQLRRDRQHDRGETAA